MDNLFHINTFKKMTKQLGISRISYESLEYLQKTTESNVKELLDSAKLLMEREGRTTLLLRDIESVEKIRKND